METPRQLLSPASPTTSPPRVHRQAYGPPVAAGHMDDKRASVRVEGDLSRGPRFVNVTVDGKPLIVRSASIELASGGRHEVVLRLPAETVDLAITSIPIQRPKPVPIAAAPDPPA